MLLYFGLQRQLPVTKNRDHQDRIVMGAERKSFYIDDKVKLMTAYHEVSRGTWVYRAIEVAMAECRHQCVREVTRWSLCIPMVLCPCTR